MIIIFQRKKTYFYGLNMLARNCDLMELNAELKS